MKPGPKFRLPISGGEFLHLALKAHCDACDVCAPPENATPQDFIDSLVVFTTQRLRALPLIPVPKGVKS